MMPLVNVVNVAGAGSGKAAAIETPPQADSSWPDTERPNTVAVMLSNARAMKYKPGFRRMPAPALIETTCIVLIPA